MTLFHKANATRRNFLHFAMASVVSAATVNAQRDDLPLRIRLIKEFRGGWLLAVSPDSRKLCLYFAKNPIDKFTLRGGKWTYEGGPSKDGKDALEVIEIGSWRALCSVRLRQYGVLASFFADSEMVYVKTDPLANASQTQHVVIDLTTQRVSESLQSSKLGEPSRTYYALSEGVLLATESVYRPPTPIRKEALLRVSLPDYKETGRVPFPLMEIAGERLGGSLTTSADRKYVVQTVIYDRNKDLGVPEGLNETVVFRRTEDLGVIWSRRIEPAADWRPERITITPDGNRGAVAVSDTVSPADLRQSYIGIYAGKDGREISKVPMDGRDGIALSPDGKVLAVGKIVPAGRGESSLIAELYELASGNRLAVVEHDRWNGGRDLIHSTGFDNDGLQFTPDGRYLITSINGLVKVWSLDPHLAAD